MLSERRRWLRARWWGQGREKVGVGGWELDNVGVALMEFGFHVWKLGRTRPVGVEGRYGEVAMWTVVSAPRI